MTQQTSDVLALIGGIQTLVENFPMGILSSVNAKTYTSSIDFVIDCLNQFGIGDAELLSLILTQIFDVNLNLRNEKEVQKWLENADDDLASSKFIQTLENILKTLISAVLTEILSCSVLPRIPLTAITSEVGIRIPVSALDPQNLFSVCPSSTGGSLVYNVSSGMTPSDMVNAKDMNAFLWYVLYQSGQEGETWKGKKKDKDICNVTQSDYTYLNFKISENYKTTKQDGTPIGDRLFQFNKDYLNSITIFSAKALATYFFDYLFCGVQSFGVSLGINEVVTQATIDNIVKNAIEIDDTEANDCYYTFSNEDMVNLLEQAELNKFNGYRNNDGSVSSLDRDKVLEEILGASNEATKFDQISRVSRIVQDIQATATSEGSSDITLINVLNNWSVNITTLIITPFVRCLFSPQVMALIMINYHCTGLININKLTDVNSIIDLIRTKLLAIIKRLVVQLKDMIVKLLLDLLSKTITPLIEKYTLKVIEEYLSNYLAILYEAVECIKLFKFTGASTTIDDVNYADITENEKLTPTQSIC